MKKDLDDVPKRLRSLTWDDYGISKERYRELQHFCRQYVEKMKKAAACTADCSIAGISYDKIGGRSSGTSSPVEKAAIRSVMRQDKYLKDVKMIEDAALWAAAVGGYPRSQHIILWSVTRGVGYDKLLARYDFVPWSLMDFYGVRRAFFARLDDLQSEASAKNTLPGGAENE